MYTLLPGLLLSQFRCSLGVHKNAKPAPLLRRFSRYGVHFLRRRSGSSDKDRARSRASKEAVAQEYANTRRQVSTLRRRRGVLIASFLLETMWLSAGCFP